MENLFFDFADGVTEATLLEDQQSDFNTHTFSSTGPGDEDDSEDKSEEEGADEGNDDENPPLDSEIVHSPVTTQTGGKPK